MKNNDGNSRKRRHGPLPLPEGEKRNHCVSVRLNASELAQVDGWRGRVQRGEYLRHAAFKTLPVVVPEINREAWAEMARVGSNLNQLAKLANAGRDPSLAALQKLYAETRMALIGIKAR
jgi:hypothetical protein